MIVSSGEVLSHRRYGEHYHGITVVAPEIGERVRPGQFVNVLCGRGRAHILRRPFSVHRVHRRGGWAPTIEIVFDVRGPGTAYLAGLRGHESLDMLGPAGRGFALPQRRAHCLLVGGGIGAAPLFFLADELRAAGHRVDFVLGARSADLLLNPIDVRRLASVYRITTEDGSQGTTGRVTDVLEEVIDHCGTEVVYACGPHPMLEAVAAVCGARRLPVQVAVEELMACGWGVCLSCVMPVRTGRGRDAEVSLLRSCTEGPVFNGARVVWDGDAGALPPEQSELAPAGSARRHGGYGGADDEHAPPGN